MTHHHTQHRITNTPNYHFSSPSLPSLFSPSPFPPSIPHSPPSLSPSFTPPGTKQFLLTLTIYPHPDVDYDRYDWVVYGIDSKYSSISTDGSEKIGSFGGCAPGVEYLYRSTCPKVGLIDS